jgi:23S rRNA (guanosine2251-2'-O)-methyltransferase
MADRRSRPLRPVAGAHACAEALKVRPQSIREVWIKGGEERTPHFKPWVEFCKTRRVPLKVVSEAALAKLGSGHQGLCIYLDETPECDWDAIEQLDQATLCALDEIEDPQNLGAILRTSWLAGVQGIVTPSRRAASLTATVSKVASGGAEHVPIEIVQNWLPFLSDLRQKDFWIFGLSGTSKKKIWDLKVPSKVIWVVGSEESGLRSSTLKVCDELVGIPQIDAGASYNASVALAMALAETLRQRSSRFPKETNPV